VQIDAADFYGRTPLVSVLLRKEAIAPILENMIRSYLATGATLEAVQELVSRAQLPLEKLQATTYYEDEGSRE
jgi:hypothetical protein